MKRNYKELFFNNDLLNYKLIVGGADIDQLYSNINTTLEIILPSLSTYKIFLEEDNNFFKISTTKKVNKFESGKISIKYDSNPMADKPFNRIYLKSIVDKKFTNVRNYLADRNNFLEKFKEDIKNLQSNLIGNTKVDEDTIKYNESFESNNNNV